MKPAAIPARPTMEIPMALLWFPSLFADALALALEAEALAEEADALAPLALVLTTDPDTDTAKSY